MTQEQEGLGADASAVSELFSEIKIHVPAWRTGSVSRSELIGTARRSGARVVAVAAPAGYGKSTLLAEWAATERRRVVWVGFDATDDDAGFLLALIASAMAGLIPVADGRSAGLRGNGSEVLGRSAPILAGAVANAREPFVLFLDDMQCVSSSGCTDALEILLRAIPPGSQVVCAGRSTPPFVARLRLDGSVHEVGTRELSLDRAAARQIFRQAGTAEVTDDDLDAVVEHSEGWASGIYLSALVARSGGVSVPGSGCDVYIADYLHAECLRRLPEDVQRFLRRTAVLERMSAPLCNAVLGTSDASAYLRRLEEANLFLVPLDHERAWFRYHVLFRDFLRVELERVEGAAAVGDLHRAAAAWLLSHDAPVDAVEHLLAADDRRAAADLVAQFGLELYQRGRIAVVRDWYRRLGDDMLRAHWELMVQVVWSASLVGDDAAGERWTRVLHAVDVDALPEKERPAFLSARAMIDVAQATHGHQRLAVDAAFATDHEPADSPWRDQAVHLRGVADLLNGDLEAARRSFCEAVDLAERAGNSDTVILVEPELALLDMRKSDWAAAAAHVERAVERIEISHMHGYPTTALALAVAARVALHAGADERGRRLLVRGMRVRVGCTHLLSWFSIRVRLQLAKAYLTLGDRTAARQLLREVDDLADKRPVGGTLSDDVERLRAVAEARGATAGTVPLTPAELRLLPYLQTHLTLAQIGGRLYISRNTVSTQVSAIYRKLAVSSRGEAVARAIDLGLLG
ncbi:LuxR C-terminal-related transcriptional regulator [Gordonia iterans]